MSEFSTLRPSLTTVTNVGTMMPVTEQELCLTPEALSQMLSSARSSNSHTKPPHYGDKASVKKLIERVEAPINAVHLNPFLRLYQYGSELIPDHVLKECLSLCAMNDPEWVHSCQSAAIRMFATELDARHGGSSATLFSSFAAKHSISGDEPVLLSQLRSQLPLLMNAAVPHVIPSTCAHFRFVVDTLLDETRDRYFSAQVKIKLESKNPVAVKIAQRLTLLDGSITADSTDFQCLIDKSTIKKGESCILLLSLIAKPYAVFNSIQEMIVLSFDDIVKVCVSFVVVNPSTPLFGTGFPCCLTQQVQQSPLGSSYGAPMTLQLLKHQFIRQQGYTCTEVCHLLCGYSHMFGPQNTDILRQATKIQSLLEEEVNLGTLLAQFWTSQKDASITLPSLSSSSPASVAPTSSHRLVPPSLSQPPGYTPGSLVPSQSQSSCTTFPNVQTKIPECLQSASPAILLSLILIWFSELPEAVFDYSICACDPLTYLETLQPYQQHLVRWVIEFCCGMLAHKEATELNVRSLALTFSAVMIGRCPDSIRRGGSSRRGAGGGSNVFTLLHEEKSSGSVAGDGDSTTPRGLLSTGTLSDDSPSPDQRWSFRNIATESSLTQGGGDTSASAVQEEDTEAWRKWVSLRLHVVTALVHYITLYENTFLKAMK